MNRATAPAESGDRRGLVVRKPRVTDAVGCSLRDVFGTDLAIPADIASLLRRLDTHARH